MAVAATDRSGRGMMLEERWRRLEQRAQGYLAHPLSVPEPALPAVSELVASIWRYPSFQPLQSWALVRVTNSGPDSWIVRRVTWNRGQDWAWMDPLKQAVFLTQPERMPTIEVADAPIEPSAAASIRGRLPRSSVPLLLDQQGVFLDGTRSGIEIEGQQVRVQWWGDGPAAWREWTGEVERIRQELDAAVAIAPDDRR